MDTPATDRSAAYRGKPKIYAGQLPQCLGLDQDAQLFGYFRRHPAE